MPHPLLQTETDHTAPKPSITLTTLPPSPPPPSTLNATQSISAPFSASPLHDPVLNTYALIPLAQSRLRKPGDIEVVVITAEEMEKMPDRFGGKITKESTTRTGPSLAEFPVFGYTVPEFGDLKDQGLEVLAWRVFGSGDKVFMDTDGYGLPGVSEMIQAWFERI
ncbi:hypothetical protein FCIRC_14020 [Fusarium circinatum]|uniref:Uncharacterized protein n=1 Tax=Fusarium circinatum TaxID=48490 RepID=A0A8H5SKT5_FUSCI|nr:hypothetical protein FCIRC_14020 [Fusarium circinatum]